MICDSFVRPATLVRICDECNYGSYQGRCVICGGPGVSDAYYCKECTIQEKDVCGSLCTLAFLSYSFSRATSRAPDKENGHAPRVQRSRSKRLEPMEIVSKT